MLCPLSYYLKNLEFESLNFLKALSGIVVFVQQREDMKPISEAAEAASGTAPWL